MIQSTLVLIFHSNCLLLNLRGKCFSHHVNSQRRITWEGGALTVLPVHVSKLKGHNLQHMNFLTLGSLMALLRLCCCRGRFLERFMACILNGYKSWLIVWWKSYANRGRDKVDFCNYTLYMYASKNVAVVNRHSILDILKVCLHLCAYRYPSASVFFSTVTSALIQHVITQITSH